MSAATRLTPSRPRIIVLSSRVLQPPVSGVPVAGATVATHMKKGNQRAFLSLVALPRPDSVATGQVQLRPKRQPPKNKERNGRAKLTGGIQSVDVDTQVNRLLRADPVADLAHNPVHANGVDLAGLDDFEAAVAVVVVVGEAGQGGADAGVDVGVVGQEALGVRVVEVGAVVDGRLRRGGPAEDARFPCVAVGGRGEGG